MLETYKMPRTEILRIRSCIYITVIYFHLELMSKSVSLKILGQDTKTDKTKTGTTGM